MKKVLLINPYWKRPGLRDRVRRDSGVAHPGLLQIAEILLRHDKNVALLDLVLAIARKIRIIDPEILILKCCSKINIIL